MPNYPQHQHRGAPGRPAGHGGFGGAGAASSQPSSALSPADAKRIIAEGDAQLLVERAQELAQAGATRTSLRRLYGEVRQIEAVWRDNSRETEAKRRVVLFAPRLAYQASRSRELGPVRQALDPLLAEVRPTDEGGRERFRHFVDFFEAVIAYAREDREGAR